MSNQAKILIVDDEPGIRVTLSGILEDEGFQVTDCDGGLKVLDRLANLDENDWPDLIITDINMPDVDGFQLLRFLKEGDSDRPVIFISGQATLDNAVEAVNRGAYAFHVKPLDIDALVNSVRNALRQHQLSVENRDLLKKLRKSNQTLRTYNEQLQAASERYRQLFYDNPVPMFVHELGTLDFLAVNEAAIQHYGYTRDEFLKMTLRDIRLAEDIHILEKGLKAWDRSFHMAGIWRHCKKDGSIIYVDINAHTLTFDGRSAALVLAHDVTEQRRAQALEQEVAAIKEVAKIVTSKLDIGQVFDLFGKELQKLVPFDSLSLVLVDEEKRTWQVANRFGRRLNNIFEQGKPYPLAASMTQHVMDSKAALICNDMSHDERFWTFKQFVDSGFHSMLLSPLKGKDGVIGAVGLFHRDAGKYGPREEQLTNLLAGQIVPAVENAQLFQQVTQAREEEKLRSEELQALFDISRVLAGPSGIEEKIASALIVMRNAVDADFANLRIVDKDHKELELIAFSGEGLEWEPTLPVENSLGGEVFRSGMPAIFNDYQREAVVYKYPHLKIQQVGSLVALPLRYEGETLGVVSVFSTAENHFSGDRVSFLAAIADGFGSLLENTRLMEAERLRILELQAATKELRESENKYRTLVEQAADAIFLLDPDDGALTEVNPRMEVLTGYSREELLGMSMPVLFCEADRVGAAEVLNGAVSQGKAGVQHLSFQPRAGDPISIDLHCNLVEYQGRKLVLGVARDITGRRRAEEMVRRANLKLEQLQRFQAIQAAREDEQRNLAGELHDETMSDLAGLAVDISLLRRDVHSQTGVETELGRVREKIRDMDARLREIVEGIYPSVLTDLGLVSAVKSHLDRLTSRPVSNPNPIQITFSARGFENGRLSEVIEIALYRIIQQAVGNAIAHGEPGSLIVDLAWKHSEVLASVADDGKGFDPGAATSTHRNGHFGLETLKYRTEGLGGTLQIDSARGKGTTIRSRIPVNTPGSGAETVQRGSYLIPAQETD